MVNGSEIIRSDRRTQGHRVLHPDPFVIDHAVNYLNYLEKAFVQVDPTQRQTTIANQVQQAAQGVSGRELIYPDLLQEVKNLVEWPSAVVGKFDPEFLSLPAEVIKTVMVSHQRYFPIVNPENTEGLLPYFVTVSNGNPTKQAVIAAGNERVIRARLSDAQFFFKADQAIPLEAYLPRLEKVTFQEDLGSVREKVKRICINADRIADQLQVDLETRALIQRAAHLCKADLVTQMVGEFPELQGIMGQKYALASGEPATVATAIFEHYLPRGASDSLARSLVGQVVGLADRLDTLVSIFGLGMLPTGSSDPFGLRRAANAIISITWAANLPINLRVLLSQACAEFVATYPKAQPLAVLESQLKE
ncbi:MAG TPA: glycine--tRNA ligase subunit beta, partial [Candidatus Caenarcaniphilales bacterium]